jgi:hypothetical protein
MEETGEADKPRENRGTSREKAQKTQNDEAATDGARTALCPPVHMDGQLADKAVRAPLPRETSSQAANDLDYCSTEQRSRNQKGAFGRKMTGQKDWGQERGRR